MAIKTIEINNVFFSYSVGNTFIAIWTKAKGQWAKLPDHLCVNFTINAPAGEFDEYSLVGTEIRKKVAEQRASGKFAKLNIEERQSKQAEKMRATDNLFREWE